MGRIDNHSLGLPSAGLTVANGRLTGKYDKPTFKTTIAALRDVRRVRVARRLVHGVDGAGGGAPAVRRGDVQLQLQGGDGSRGTCSANNVCVCASKKACE
jgi:hypothetical protein